MRSTRRAKGARRDFISALTPTAGKRGTPLPTAGRIRRKRNKEWTPPSGGSREGKKNRSMHSFWKKEKKKENGSHDL